ncbi:hypothetical protein GCM10009037_13320 [Halarchaeum grantii]|uniref:Cox cluster protein n=1 Tax=Halarchaeum grantii TaxID=1193105 RepID=A0A830F8Z9_9EURY|nr:hypothetical protein [Halarchaeum grantii]GGL30903.1 hypothetical protein GCM10009037_13320 [Halarchaeum grantii]
MSFATGGRRVVFTIYGAAVAIAGLFGYALGYVIQPNLLDGHVGSLGPVTFALTPLNLAIYGMVMVGAMLGVLLLLVSYVSRFDDATPVEVE